MTVICAELRTLPDAPFGRTTPTDVTPNRATATIAPEESSFWIAACSRRHTKAPSVDTAARSSGELDTVDTLVDPTGDSVDREVGPNPRTRLPLDASWKAAGPDPARASPRSDIIRTW